MKIKYSKRRLYYTLASGTIWLLYSLLGVFIGEDLSWKDYGFMIISFIYLGIYFYEKKNQYLTIANGIISINQPFGKKIKLAEIKQIKKFSGDYILKTDQTELIVNTEIIDEKSLTELNAELEKLNVEIK